MQWCMTAPVLQTSQLNGNHSDLFKTVLQNVFHERQRVTWLLGDLESLKEIHLCLSANKHGFIYVRSELI